MNSLDRRQFLQISAAALLAATDQSAQAAESRPARIAEQGGMLRVTGTSYTWEWSPSDDHFRLLDSKGLLIATAPLQPLVVVSLKGGIGARHIIPGKPASHSTHDGSVTFLYEDVNGHARLSVTWRFEDQSFRIEPLIYSTSAAEDVVSLHYFARVQEGHPVPSLECSFLIDPGISEGSSISPIVRSDVGLKTRSWLGRGSFSAGLHQQWGLPAHFFCGFNINHSQHGARDEYTRGRSATFCCGLADLPNGDLFLDMASGRGSVLVNYRSDLWGHLRGPGRMSLGAGFYWALGANYYEAIREYYQGLMRAGIIRRKTDSPRKTAIALTPQFCTWGAQVDRGKTGDRLDQAFLDEIYQELKTSGMQAGMFSIDDKWEGRYGKLEHASDRLPRFVEFLDQVRADGRRVGLWAAFMRCEDPRDIGLTPQNMLRQPDGKPFSAGGGRYYILDFTQPEVEKVARELARNFMRRYHPDLVKFDFGYELPSVDIAAPQDKRWAGERLMHKGLEIVVSAMREVNPDVVLMYYQLSPLFLDYLDLHSPDDLYLAAGEYDLEANRRFFFSSLLGTLGVPTYGSSGYDWQSAPNIWFDSTVVGTLGSLNDFQGDEQGEAATPERVAKYNGLTHVLRQSSVFRVLPLDTNYEAPTRGARSRSWARFENDELVLVALRPGRDTNGAFDESPSENAKIHEAVRSAVPVVVASRTRDGIDKAGSLVVVPYGDGEVRIRRAQGGRVEVTEHWFGGTTTTAQAIIQDGFCRLKARVKNENNTPLEWLELHISS